MGNIPLYAVLQNEVAAPTAAQLKRVFREFHHLTDADAVRLAAGARGILMRHLRRDAARALQRVFEAEGIGVTVVGENDLPELPEAHSLHRLNIWPQAFTVYDLRGRRISIPWEEITLVAAGEVLHYEVGKARAGASTAFSAGPATWPRRTEKPVRKLEAEPQLWLEILSQGGTARYQLDAAKFTFRYVIDRPGLSLEEKFIWLVREICRQATHAIFNPGAQLLRDGREKVPPYMNRQTLTDEIIWLLWRQAGGERGG